MKRSMTDPLASRWLHRWSVLTVCATFVLLGLGSVVTNLRAGMADPSWPTKPTALLDFSPEQYRDVLLVVEHSHRLAGYVVGCCTIVLAAWLWLRGSPLSPNAWLGIVFPLIMAGFAISLLKFGNHLSQEEPAFLLEFLERTIDARVTAET